jgi:hypothetical protein
MNLITTAQASEIIGISPYGVIGAIRRGQLEAVKIGRDWLMEAKEAERYKVERRKPGRPKGTTRLDSA